MKCYIGDSIVDPRCKAEVVTEQNVAELAMAKDIPKDKAAALLSTKSLMKVKGAPGKASAKQLRPDDFKDPERRPKSVEYTKIRGVHARIFNETNKRVVLNFADGKQYWFENGTSLPFGHKSIPTASTMTVEDIEEALLGNEMDVDEGMVADIDTDAD